MTLPVAVFASGSGSNLQSLLDYTPRRPDAGYRIALVVSDRPEAGALERASAAGVPSRVIPVSGRDAGEVADDTLGALEGAGVSFVALAGYLRLVPVPVVAAFRRRIVNIHPALLPAFGGKGMYGIRVHEAVLRAGCRVTGPTIHYVDERYDEGTVIAQWPVPVLAGDGAPEVAKRVLAVEHLLYPRVLDHLCRAVAEGRDPEPFAPRGDTFVPAEPGARDVSAEIEAALGRRPTHRPEPREHGDP